MITNHPKEETQESIRLFHLIKKTLPILSYNDSTDESVKPVLNTFAEYEPGHESPPLSINNAKNVRSSLINISTAAHNPTYYKKSKTGNMTTKIHEATQTSTILRAHIWKEYYSRKTKLFM